MATLISTTHHWNVGSDQIHFEFIFSDGKVFSDKILRGSDRAIIANHFQQAADILRQMDSVPATIDEDE